jgi:hypothetical protein
VLYPTYNEEIHDPRTVRFLDEVTRFNLLDGTSPPELPITPDVLQDASLPGDYPWYSTVKVLKKNHLTPRNPLLNYLKNLPLARYENHPLGNSREGFVF